MSELLRPAPPFKEPLLIEVEDGYEVHDFHDWNDSREEIKRKRADGLARVRKHRTKRVSEKTTDTRYASSGVGVRGTYVDKKEEEENSDEEGQRVLRLVPRHSLPPTPQRPVSSGERSKRLARRTGALWCVFGRAARADRQGLASDSRRTGTVAARQDPDDCDAENESQCDSRAAARSEDVSSTVCETPTKQPDRDKVRFVAVMTAAMGEYRRLWREGLSKEDAGRQVLEPAVRKHWPRRRKEPWRYDCEECKDIGLRSVWEYEEIYDGPVEKMASCLCARGLAKAQRPKPPNDTDPARKVAENWRQER